MNALAHFVVGTLIGFVLMTGLIYLYKRWRNRGPKVSEELVERIRQFLTTQAPFRDAQGIFIGLKAIEHRLTEVQINKLFEDCLARDWRYMFKDVQLYDIRRALRAK